MRRSFAWLVLAVICPAAFFATGCTSKSADKAGASGTGETTPLTELVPSAGQAFVTGSVRRFTANGARTGMPLATPFTISALERGSGNATIENALVGGQRSTISWATGTPLPISGTGGLDLGAASVDVDTVGITWHLDDAVRAFVPGTYRANAPVAVGSTGLAQPRDSVEFQADERTVLTTRGGVVVHLSPAPLKIEGPGDVNVAGTLQVRTPSGKRAAGSVAFQNGPFTATLTPAGSQVRLDSVLQGTVTAT